MTQILKMLVVLVGVAGLAACFEQETGDTKAYLMQHPRKLSEEVSVCQTMSDGSEPSPRCKLVIDAAQTIMPLIEAHQRNPQAFGQRVLEAEMNYARTGNNEAEVKTLLAIVGLSSPE